MARLDVLAEVDSQGLQHNTIPNAKPAMVDLMYMSITSPSLTISLIDPILNQEKSQHLSAPFML